MANIRISAVEIEVSNRSILKEYSNYINTVDESSRTGSQSKLESYFTKIYNARKVGGNPPLVPDYYVSGESLVKNLSPFFAAENSSLLNIEAKFSRRGEGSGTQTTIGGRVSGEILPQIRRQKGLESFAAGKDDNIKEYMNKVLKIKSGSELFNFMRDNAPDFHKEAYNKSKNLTIFAKASSTSVLAYQIYFPENKFISGIFGVNYAADNNANSLTFSYFLNNSFEKSLKDSVQDAITKTNVRDFKNLRYENFKSKSIGFGERLKGGKTAGNETIEIYWAHSNSIPVANIIAKLPKRNSSKPSQPSILDLTMLVRGRARLKMRRGSGTPNPPKIFERSGTFRDSIQAVANMQSNTINYFYLPYYDALERYGYEINELVEGSIRAIAMERIGKQFILRKNTQPII
jgi:hypothetical protein